MTKPLPAPSIWQEIQALARLGFPVVISLAAATLIGVVDTFMIAPLGTIPLAAASITASVMMICYSVIFGFVSATGVRMAEAFGKSDEDALSVATRTGLIVTFSVGLIATLLMMASKPLLSLIGQPDEVINALGGYWFSMSALLIPFGMFYALKSLFDAIGAPWIGVALAFMAVIVNVPANWLLIHGFGGWSGLGLLGAGLASLLSQGLSLLLGWIIWKRADFTAIARETTGPISTETGIQLKEGATIALGYFGEGGAYAVVGLLMGGFGAAALASIQIVSSVSDVLYMVPMGIAIAVSIRIGQAVGAKETARPGRIGRAALILIISWMTIVMLAILFARHSLTTALSNDPEVIALALSMFLLVAAMQVFDGIQGTMLGACRGITDNRVPVLITIVSYWMIALPLGYMLGFKYGYGPNGVWIGYSVGLAIAAAWTTSRFFKVSSRRRLRKTPPHN